MAAAAGGEGATARPASGGRTIKGPVPYPREALDRSPTCKTTGPCQPALAEGPETEGSVPPPSSQSPPARTVTGVDVMAAETSATTPAIAHRVAQARATTMPGNRSWL